MSTVMNTFSLRAVDLALITQGSGEQGGTLLLRERLVWVASAGHRAHMLDPLPLAIFEPGCPFRRAAMETLARSGRTFRIAYTSVSLAGVHAAIDAGLVTEGFEHVRAAYDAGGKDNITAVTVKIT